MSHTLTKDNTNSKTLERLLRDRILVTDGAMGTALDLLHPTAKDYGDEAFVGCNEMLNLHAPNYVIEVHKNYIEAGADIIETNSFNGSPIVMEEYGVRDMARDLAKRSAKLAQEAVKRYAQDRPVFVMGSMGPGTKSITVTGGVSFDEIYDAYYEYAAGLLEGGSDILVLETVQDTLNLKAALLGVQAAQKDLKRNAPLAVSVTIEPNGTMLAGQNIEALYHTVSSFDLFSIGLNCATGPAMMSDHLRTLANLSRFPISVWPNAGLPDHDGNYSEGPDVFREVIERFAREGFINIVGGCCGTTLDHIQAIRDAVAGVQPRCFNSNGHYPTLAGAEAMVVEKDNRPVFIGERTNTIGSRKFKRLINEGKWDEAAEIGRKQVHKGAMVIDLCVANPDREEVLDFINVVRPLMRKVRVPLLIDTTDPQVVESAFKTIGGKPAVNSVNLEDGGKRLREIATLAKKYGASLICGMIDNDPQHGMAVTIERKLEIAEKIYRILKDEFNFPDNNIIFDPLVFPAATGDPNYLGAAKATIEATRLIKEKYPNSLTVLGISNVSFGLPPAGREVVNSVFLYLCVQVGLDMAIVNTQRLRRYPAIPVEDIELAEKLLMQGDSETISTFTARYRDKKIQVSEDGWQELTIKERISRAVIEARREGLKANLTELLNQMPPLEIVNGPLMSGMDRVGQLFADNRLIVAEVLESAEVMKTAVDFIRPYFPAGETASVKGKLLLATVKGDVHDIGKNLVFMILSNNGFEVIDIGIKVPPTAIIEAVKKHKPDMIGLSGLLVRSAQQMIATAQDLSASGIDLPLIVGGAALTKKFVQTRIAPAYNGDVYYASDAMTGLVLCNRIVSDLTKYEKPSLCHSRESGNPGIGITTINELDFRFRGNDKAILQGKWIETDVPQPPDLNEHILTSISVDAALPYINHQMLYGRHLGVKNLKKRLNDLTDEKIKKLKKQVDEIAHFAEKEEFLQPRAIYRWFRTKPDGEHIAVQIPDSDEFVRFHFPRQKNGNRISAVDWIRPWDQGGDYIGLFVTTADKGVSDRAAELRNNGRLIDSLILQSLSIELAEAAAIWLHRKMRAEWGFQDPPAIDLNWRHHTKYRGIRLSFGYPACPDLEDQRKLFALLKPDRIGITLTEEHMMVPEGSVTAVVFHHPRGKYYKV